MHNSHVPVCAGVVFGLAFDLNFLDIIEKLAGDEIIKNQCLKIILFIIYEIACWKNFENRILECIDKWEQFMMNSNSELWS